jgi:hypothetical protein
MKLRDRRAQQIRELALLGKARQEIADEILLSYQSVVKYGIKYDIPIRHASAGPSDGGRADAMASMYRSGKTLEQIGQLYGVSRERVRQVISKYRGVKAGEGGQAAKSKLRRQQLQAKKEADCQARWGCSTAEYKGLRDIERAMMRGGAGFYKTPRGAFTTQRNNARNRDIEWNLTLWQWWAVWRESRKWEQRGRSGDSFVMCRFKDDGPYEIGNVYIATLRHNSAVQPNNRYRSSHPDFEKAMAERLQRLGHSDRRCDELDCDRPHYAHGLCQAHYSRVRYRASQEARAAA